MQMPCSVRTIFFTNKPHTQTFLTLQPKWAPEEELCLSNNSAFRGRNSTNWINWIIVIQMSSLFIHITNFLIPGRRGSMNLWKKYWHKVWISM